MLDGVTVPYEEVVGVRTDESKLGFIIVDHKYTQIHVRMFTRSEFNVWREALDPSTSNSTPHGAHTESTSPTAYATAQKWLARNNEDLNV